MLEEGKGRGKDKTWGTFPFGSLGRTNSFPATNNLLTDLLLENSRFTFRRQPIYFQKIADLLLEHSRFTFFQSLSEKQPIHSCSPRIILIADLLYKNSRFTISKVYPPAVADLPKFSAKQYFGHRSRFTIKPIYYLTKMVIL